MHQESRLYHERHSQKAHEGNADDAGKNGRARTALLIRTTSRKASWAARATKGSTADVQWSNRSGVAGYTPEVCRHQARLRCAALCRTRNYVRLITARYAMKPASWNASSAKSKA